MKTSYKYLAIAFAALLCSCNEGITPDMIESQVQISANITPCVLTRVTDDGTSFTDGDAIKVQNMDRDNKNLATYTYSESTGKWSTSDELYWDGEAANTFNAWYPASAAYGSFTIPADQTSGIADADWMTATASAKKTDGIVNLSFTHNLAKVTVTIDSWSNEYSANEKIANSLELNSLSSVMSYDGTLLGDNTAKWIKAYVAQANTSFAAIIAPGTYDSEEDIMQIYVNGSSTPLAVKTSSVLTIESGKAYSFKLAVGENLAEITSSVTIGEWDDIILEDQQVAAEVIKKIYYIDEYGINHGVGVEIDGVTWAPVNCGYHATDYPYGKLYQWGRKYGQGYSLEYDLTEPTIVRDQISLAVGQSKENENVFFTLDNTLWKRVFNETLWPNTQYDPCPEGWQVPSSADFKTLASHHSEWVSINEQNGYFFSGSKSYDQNVPQIFLPAAGYRTGYDVVARQRNDYGCYQSYNIVKSDNEIRTLDIDEDGVDDNARGVPGDGYSIRCIKVK